MAKATRSKTKLYLLGEPVTVLTGSKLPSLHMTLGLFLHHHIELKQTIRKSSAITITEIAKFWLKARLPIKDHQHCQTKLEKKVFDEWKLLNKNKGRTYSTTQLSKEADFVSKLDDLFDVAHVNALTSPPVLQEDKDFLLAQREKGRRGSTVGVDQALTYKEKRASQRKIGEQTRRRKMEDRQQASCSTTELISSSSDTTDTSSAEDGDKLDEQCAGAVGADLNRGVKRKRGRKSVITQELAMTLDRTKVSDRQATMVITFFVMSAPQQHEV